MIRRKLVAVLFGLLAIVAMNAIAASSASAVVFELGTEECTGGLNIGACWSETEAKTDPLLELVGKQTVRIEGGHVTFKVTQLTILCLKFLGEGTLNQETPLKTGFKPTITNLIITFEECELDEPASAAAKCKVPLERSTKTITGTLPNENEIHLAPSEGTTFIEIPIENKGSETCPAALKGTHSVTGSVNVKIGEPLEHKVTHTFIVINPTLLEFFSEKATLEAEGTIAFPGLEHPWDLEETV